MNPEQAYQELIRLSREETLLASCIDVLEWDEEINLPRKAVSHRSDQLAFLAGLLHDRSTSPRYDELLSILEASALMSNAESPPAVNVRELRRGYDRERRMPKKLVEESARVTSLASRAWVQARRNNDFKSFAPWLEKIFLLAREEADAAGHNGTRYDALLDEYEPGMTTSVLSSLFTELGDKLTPLVDALRCESKPGPATFRAKRFPLDKQRHFAERIAAAVGFNLDAARFDLGIIPSVLIWGPAMYALLCALLQPTSLAEFSHFFMKWVMVFTTRDSIQLTTERRWAKLLLSVFTNRSRGSGKTLSGEARASGAISIRNCRELSHEVCATSRWKLSVA